MRRLTRKFFVILLSDRGSFLERMIVPNHSGLAQRGFTHMSGAATSTPTHPGVERRTSNFLI